MYLNSDLELTPNGTRAVNIIGNTINLSSLSSGIIKNDSTGALTISTVDQGYPRLAVHLVCVFRLEIIPTEMQVTVCQLQIGDTRFNRTNGGFLETWDGNVWQVTQAVVETLSQAEMEDPPEFSPSTRITRHIFPNAINTYNAKEGPI